MDLTHLHSLTHIHKESLASLLKVNKTLSYSQANINLLVGHSLRHHSSRESLKTYLSLIPLLESLEIKGSPKVGNIDYLINFIENYYQTLSELQEKSENQRIQAKVRETVSQHIKEKLLETLLKLGSNLKMTEKLKFVTILNCWSYLDLETSAAEEIFEHLSRYFTQELRVSHKNEVVLVAVFRLIIKTLKVNGELFQLYKEKVAALFKRAQAICKKYLGNKNTKEKSFLIACEFILLTLGSDCTEDGRLADVQLPSLYGKSYYVESYFCYFFKHTYQVLKRPNITAKFMLACKANLVNYVKKREDCLETTLNSLFGLLKLTEEPEVTIILIRTIYELFVQSSVKARNKYLVPFILTSKQDLKTKVSSDLISLLVKLVEEDQFKSIDKLFADIHLDLNEDEIHWVVKVVKGLPNYWKISEIIKIFLLNYKRMILDQKITTELIKALLSLSEVFPNIIIEEVLATINELLLTHEKNRWIRGSEQESSTSLKRYLSLLTVIKASAKYLTNFITSNKISEFWLIITHFSVHYSLTEVISLIDLNETLHAVARLTPNLFMSSSKESQSIFAQLSQSDNFVSVFAPNLRTGLSAFCGKKVLDQYDYQVLIIVAAVKKYLDLIDCDRLFEELFGYLGLDTLTFHSALTELISGYIHERWKEIIRSRQVPLQETLSLLKHCLSQNKSVRALAMKMLTGNSESVVTLFHGVLYHYPCLALMLDLISGLELQSNFEYSSTIPYVQLPHLNEALAVPCYKATLTEIKSVLENSFKEMFVKCVWQSHSHILSTFQFYLFSSNKILKTNEDPQVASVINHSQHFFNQCFYSTRFIPNDKFSLIQSYLTPEKFHSWFKQQKMTCEVKVLENNSVQLQNNLLLMADSFIQNEGKLSFLVSELKKAASSTDSPDKPSELFDALGKLTAFLIIKKDLEVPSELVHIPLEISPSTAVFFWEWLINMRPLSRRKIFLEVSFSWLNFLKFHHFLYSSVNFRIKPDLLNGHCMEFKAGPGEFRQVLDLVVFLQKQFYSTTHDLDSQKILLKIFEMTFEEKPSADVLSFEAGLEAVLRILETFIVSRSFFDDLMFSRTFAKMVEFCLFFFRNGHSWVKALTFSQESRIQALFEKVIHGLHDVKISPETVQINDYQFFNTPATWKTRKNSEILVFAVKEKISVQVTKEKVEILMIFLYRDYQRFIAWNSCLHGKIISCPRHTSSKQLKSLAMSIDLELGSYFSLVVQSRSRKTYKKNLGSNENEKKFLFNLIRELPPILNQISSENPCERSFFLKFLARSPERNKLYFIPQVLQCGSPQNLYENYSRIKGEEDVWTFLTTSAQHSSVFLNQLIWMLEVSLFNPEKDLSKTTGNHFYHKTLEIIKKDAEEWEVYKTESEFFEKFLMVSAHLTPKDPENFSKINSELKELSKNIPENIYIPTNPENLVVGLRDDNGRPLQSAKRTPILVTFYTKQKGEDLVTSTQCIFKVNDDVRNDQLCLQIIDLMQDILSKTGLTIYLRPYKVISTITQTSEGPQLSGIIECIPNCKSRDEIGKEGTPSLYTYFLDKFGVENTKTYQNAKNNFIASLAGYAVASYLLQIKDRHNGNILIDEFGHIVHIDFGFILKISPGGNMRFERPGFKMTEEMIDVMGSRNSESFEYFKGLIIKGYLAVREHAESFITLISLMEHSGLTCFRKGAVKDFVKRFYLNMTVVEAIKKMNEKILRANNSFFTLWYDRIQLMQQQIEY